MIISRTPLRMSFVGGGSDLPSFYRSNGGGAVISTAVDKFVYVTINKKFDDGIRVAYSKTEEVRSLAEIQHKLVRTTFEMMNVNGGVEITTVADIPSRGTGLGSSSSFTVGLINVLAAYLGRHMASDDLGRLSCEVEIDRCGEPIGKQDQYAAAFGGFNLIEFRPDDSVHVSPVIISREVRETLERRIIAFYTGMTRSASDILRKQDADITSNRDKQRSLRRMVSLVYELRDELSRGGLDSFGYILDENWRIKKSLSLQISNGQIDDWYNAATAAGALGGKILGAGAGGFLIFYADESKHDAVAAALPELRRVSFKFEPRGSQIIFYNP
jgi:D-glycero-alpha-D-manno-heptose-7-phosphate kinase